MIRININGYEVSANIGDTILEAAASVGIEIPTLCHDKSLDTYGACGICAVETQGSPKLLRACSTVISPGMVVYTDTPRVLTARKAVLELLLSDHIGDCRPPCMRACPAETDCQGYVGLIANGEFQAAYDLIMEKLPLPASIGRVCPHPCEGECRRALVGEPADKPIAIADLKRFAADYVLEKNSPAPVSNIESKLAGKRVSVIGGGPGGLSAAYFLRMKGADVSVFDAQPLMGGMLRYGIPEYRLPKAVLDAEIATIEATGVKLINNVRIGQDISFNHIRNASDAVIIAIGAWTSSKLGCDGEDMPGVIGGIDFLFKAAKGDLTDSFRKVAVVGGGNTAMDACRTAIRLGAETVYNVYRRTRAEMPAEDIEIEEAGEEGVEFKFLCNPIEIIEKGGKAAAIKLQKMELGEPDASGRRRPVAIPGAEEILEVDLVIAAIGQGVDASGMDGLNLSRWKTIVADEDSFETNLEGVFAIGDAINNGAGIAIEAIGDARRGVEAVSSYLMGQLSPCKKEFVVTSEPDLVEYKQKESIPRIGMDHLSPEQRRSNFLEINHGYTYEQAVAEAKRCLECGCMDYFECKLLRYSREIGVDAKKYAGRKASRGTDESNSYIALNRDKCILCGQCVRVCDEVVGRFALGLTERGFDTSVSPELKRPLAETSCISCGQCVSLCPTGAFSEKLAISKSVPLDEKRTDTVCSGCGLGCEAIACSYSNLMLRMLPKDGSLCVRGRFEQISSCDRVRITAPSIRKGTEYKMASFSEAYTAIIKGVQRTAGIYGKESIAVNVSDKLTNEDIYLITQYAKEAFGQDFDNIFSYNLRESGLKPVLGVDSSTNSLAELDASDVIMLIAPDIIDSHLIAGLKIRNAASKGTKVILVSGKKTQADEFASIKLDINDENQKGSDDGVQEILKQVLAVYNPPELEGSLNDVSVGSQAIAAAEMLRGAKNAIIVYDTSAVSAQTENLLANIAITSGHLGSPRNGIIALRRNCNSQGLIDMGVRSGAEVLDTLIAEGKFKALISFGEDITGIEHKNLDFLAVFGSIKTNAADAADIIMPLSASYESNGTYTSTERMIKKVNGSLTPVCGKSNAEIIAGLASANGKALAYDAVAVEIGIKCDIAGYEDFRPGAFTYGSPFLKIENNIDR